MVLDNLGTGNEASSLVKLLRCHVGSLHVQADEAIETPLLELAQGVLQQLLGNSAPSP
eukprot:CAMPEP_0194773138 /NCGR_PEP_ID=MMETSP0323_2-20130528/54028_1 /TAXON_ID=2866 ORGANISM="Crypthecodinium cohnii, Strain Seligo" /NCGR_SAMPLE_ID=MMETSP0323_2 /ASSEMBLY_ACC=CAM_ASM_000346 /LENGTH=57 /DNA_ID=CAMNT_0039708031 /DNA_START=439 /DNA_END=608 /DNA_ORIENTATION=+